MIKKPASPDLVKTPRAAAPNKGLHARNRNGAGYDFARLIACCPQLAAHVAPNAYGNESINFADPQAVRALNRALLAQDYGITGWDLPAQYLCPPIPGRADALHYLADLLAESNGGVIPHGEAIRVLDIGVGANCVYPLIGHGEYGWSFVGSDIDRTALNCAQKMIDANSGYREAIELRFQAARLSVFRGVVHGDELFDLAMCNPPFHSSIEDAAAGSTRKWQNLGQNLGQAAPAGGAPLLNFGGQSDELCCAGGEEGFISRMIAESTRIPTSCLWFTTLVSKATSLPEVYRAIRNAGVEQSKTIDMAQGQKKSRIVAWTFLSERQRQSWRNARRGESAQPGRQP
jgi:23S rRNA (adenine1618-N6)-methyltransferase